VGGGKSVAYGKGDIRLAFLVKRRTLIREGIVGGDMGEKLHDRCGTGHLPDHA